MNWTTEKIYPSAGSKDSRPTFVLKFKGGTMLKSRDAISEGNYKAQARIWNEKDYVPKNGTGICIAELPPEKRSDVLKKRDRLTEWLPGLVLSPDEDRDALDRYTRGVLRSIPRIPS